MYKKHNERWAPPWWAAGLLLLIAALIGLLSDCSKDENPNAATPTATPSAVIIPSVTPTEQEPTRAPDTATPVPPTSTYTSTPQEPSPTPTATLWTALVDTWALNTRVCPGVDCEITGQVVLGDTVVIEACTYLNQIWGWALIDTEPTFQSWFMRELDPVTHYVNTRYLSPDACGVRK